MKKIDKMYAPLYAINEIWPWDRYITTISFTCLDVRMPKDCHIDYISSDNPFNKRIVINIGTKNNPDLLRMYFDERENFLRITISKSKCKKFSQFLKFDHFLQNSRIRNISVYYGLRYSDFRLDKNKCEEICKNLNIRTKEKRQSLSRKKYMKCINFCTEMKNVLICSFKEPVEAQKFFRLIVKGMKCPLQGYINREIEYRPYGYIENPRLKKFQQLTDSNGKKVPGMAGIKYLELAQCPILE